MTRPDQGRPDEDQPDLPGSMTVPPLFGWGEILILLVLLLVLVVVFLVVAAAAPAGSRRWEWQAGLAARSSRPPDRTTSERGDSIGPADGRRHRA